MNVAGPLRSHALARGEHAALVQGGTVLDYRALARRVAQTQGHLGALGVRAGDLVGVSLADRAEHVVAMLALARMGAILLPLDARWTAAETERVVVHFGASRALAEADAPEIPGIALHRVDDLWQAAVAAARPDETIAAGGQAPFLVSLSSGTTGRPKGPLVTHGQFIARFRTHWINLGLNARDRFIAATPLYFGAGRTFVLSVLFSGGTVVLFPPPFPPQALLAEVAARNATSLFLVPTQLRSLLDLADATLAPLAALQLLFSSGAPLAPEERLAIRERLCANFFEYYASTEGGGITLLCPEDLECSPGSVGRPIFGVELEVVDEQGRPKLPGESGRLRYRSPGCAVGFFREENESGEAFSEGWFYPGDLASLDERGYLTLQGRWKDLIIRGGVNINPSEIEAVLRRHPQVRDAAVVGFDSRALGEEVAAFVIGERPLSSEALGQWCATELAAYKIPSRFVMIAELPRNSGGKVMKDQLRASLTTNA
jgi:acyl-coenzyme A synthetase/AMP-(fatty) acid ligase